MKRKYLAIVPLTVISLMDLPAGFSPGDIQVGLAWAATALGVLGLVTAFALVRGLVWSAVAAIAIAAVNLVGSIVAVAADHEGAAIGVVVSTVAVLGATTLVVGDRRARGLLVA